MNNNIGDVSPGSRHCFSWRCKLHNLGLFANPKPTRGTRLPAILAGLIMVSSTSVTPWMEMNLVDSAPGPNVQSHLCAVGYR